jgi:DNA-binding transcriptional LysR family regulator
MIPSILQASMRYVQLRAFHYVATCGGFSRAAEELLLTQPAISDQVRKLEEEYDVLLFNRQRKQVTLTTAGEHLLQVTRRLFDSEQQALDFLSESRSLQSGNLRIVADSAHHPHSYPQRLSHPLSRGAHFGAGREHGNSRPKPLQLRGGSWHSGRDADA